MRITAAAVHRIAEQEVLHRVSSRGKRKRRVSSERFSAIFGCSPKVAAALWNRLDKKELLPSDCLVKHLLWAFSFLKLYNNQRAASVVSKADEKTYRKWVWAVLDALAELDLVSCCLRTNERTNFSSCCAHRCVSSCCAHGANSIDLLLSADQMGEPVHEVEWVRLLDYTGWN